jgi:hypothetical protein
MPELNIGRSKSPSTGGRWLGAVQAVAFVAACALFFIAVLVMGVRVVEATVASSVFLVGTLALSTAARQPLGARSWTMATATILLLDAWGVLQTVQSAIHWRVAQLLLVAEACPLYDRDLRSAREWAQATSHSLLVGRYVLGTVAVCSALWGLRQGRPRWPAIIALLLALAVVAHTVLAGE